MLSDVSLLPQWLVFSLVGLPQFSETVYSPSMPDIAQSLHTSVPMVEYTLTIYLAAFSLGMLFWGKMSDVHGRKPSVAAGLFIYVLGCVGCYYSPTITMLLASRFLQAFGGSAGSVIGQAILRDVFHGKALSKAYATMSSALGVPPAIGPVVGGIIAQYFDWSYVFVFLTMVGILVVGCVASLLPETLAREGRKNHGLVRIFSLLIRDRKVLVYTWLVGCCSGLMFSYFSEGSFYLIEMLGLTPFHYGMTYVCIAAAMIGGGRVANMLHERFSVEQILPIGVGVMVIATGMFSLCAVATHYGYLPPLAMVIATVACHMTTMVGRCIVVSTSLSVALAEYRWCAGTASSIFGGMYYVLISLATFGLGTLHNGTLLVMPLYFLALSVIMFVALWFLRTDAATQH